MNPTLTLAELSHQPDSTGSAVLDRNLAALRRADPSGRAAAIVQSAFSRADIEWLHASGDGSPAEPMWTGALTDWTLSGAVQRSLASRRDPVKEAARLADRVNTAETGAVVVLGFGLGYHVAEIARRVKHSAVLMVFEPDVGLVRAALERIDLSEALGGCALHLFTDAEDEAAMTAATQGREGLLALGTTVVEHPASQPRLGETGKAFMERFTGVMMAVRTSVVTTMVQTETTLRNLTRNIDHYAAGEGVADLAGVLAGRPAIVVSAGPSLARNVDLLGRPGVRDRFAIIATQTVLKPLLAKGIRPHFVVALDHHEISGRFYEGLTAADVAGITLVVEPKVNPVVTAAFAGAIRCVGDDFLDTLIGPELTRPMGRVHPGATVAHLAYSLARHMACDPVVLVGQDLGFTDGQYYAAGAAIHDVWAGEINGFNTLEMLEWQRIVRMRAYLRAETDVFGRPIYTDEQMAAYLLQFQALFRADEARGLLTIDSTEGGVAKAGTMARPLAESLELLGAHTHAPVEAVLPQPTGDPVRRRERIRLVIERVRDVRRGVWQVATLSREARGLLTQMLEHHADQARVNRLIAQVEQVRDRVSAVQPAFRLVEWLNQTGVFNRYKADRRINLSDDMPPLEKQRAQIERDITNVRWLADAADALGDMLDESVASCAGKPVVGRGRHQPGTSAAPHRGGPDAVPASVRTTARATATRLPAVIAVDCDFNGLGVRRDLSEAVYDGRNALQLTLARLAACHRLDAVALLCSDPARARAIVGTPPAGLRVQFFEATNHDPVRNARARRASRLPAAHCWRGGLGNLTVYDEVLSPAATADALEQRGAPAALIVGADWSLVDPRLCDALVDRYAESPEAHRLVFSQAAPGLAGCIVDHELLRQITAKRSEAGAFASVGGLLGYLPTSPTPDMLAKSMCVHVPPAVRDALVRCTLDSPAHRERIIEALRLAGADPLTADAAAIARAVASAPTDVSGVVGQTVELRLLGRGTQGHRLTLDAAARVLGSLGRAAPETVLTLAADDGLDPLAHPDFARIVQLARDADVGCVHVRTPLAGGSEAVVQLTCGPVPDIISVECSGLEEANGPLQALLAWRNQRGDSGECGLPMPWIVPRITRRDVVYERIEAWYDHWLLTAGWAVIDPLPRPIDGQRIAPLPLSVLAARRKGLLHRTFGPDGWGGRA